MYTYFMLVEPTNSHQLSIAELAAILPSETVSAQLAGNQIIARYEQEDYHIEVHPIDNSAYEIIVRTEKYISGVSDNMNFGFLMIISDSLVAFRYANFYDIEFYHLEWVLKRTKERLGSRKFSRKLLCNLLNDHSLRSIPIQLTNRVYNGEVEISIAVHHDKSVTLPEFWIALAKELDFDECDTTITHFSPSTKEEFRTWLADMKEIWNVSPEMPEITDAEFMDLYCVCPESTVVNKGFIIELKDRLIYIDLSHLYY